MHPRMGTHNRLLRLGPETYLEVIAVDPSANLPGRPRWFGMDQLAVNTPARLATWVARTDDIHAMSEACRAIVGEPEPMTRGTLSWRTTIPSDGHLPLDGSAPTLIQWEQAPHPASAMQDKGCSLVALDVFDPDPDTVQALLDAINFSGPVHIHGLGGNSKPYLVAHIQTPTGLKTLPIENRFSPEVTARLPAQNRITPCNSTARRTSMTLMRLTREARVARGGNVKRVTSAQRNSRPNGCIVSQSKSILCSGVSARSVSRSSFILDEWCREFLGSGISGISGFVEIKLTLVRSFFRCAIADLQYPQAV